MTFTAEEEKLLLQVVNSVAQRSSNLSWTSCTNPPESEGEYLITWTSSFSKKRLVAIAEYTFSGVWILDDFMRSYPDVQVLAWMPLPKPYEN